MLARHRLPFDLLWLTALGTLYVQDKKHSSVSLKAMGQAINKTVTIGTQTFAGVNVALAVPLLRPAHVSGPVCCAAEIIKRRIPGLHQETVLQSLEIKDTWQPFEVRSYASYLDGRTDSPPWLQSPLRLMHHAPSPSHQEHRPYLAYSLAVGSLHN